ncbi:unnamed protein product [Rangifer tarandus platyrhynchus]|uniref:Uncharacterized protein n=1 Tax=Rangifer tarandus platyrhynchus TaxID=3082113 RepID=A0AC59YXN3_RANTA
MRRVGPEKKRRGFKADYRILFQLPPHLRNTGNKSRTELQEDESGDALSSKPTPGFSPDPRWTLRAGSTPRQPGVTAYLFTQQRQRRRPRLTSAVSASLQSARADTRPADSAAATATKPVYLQRHIPTPEALRSTEPAGPAGKQRPERSDNCLRDPEPLRRKGCRKQLCAQRKILQGPLPPP